MENSSQGEYLPIGGYALIGNMQAAALVGLNGSIDWCCLPCFDSPAVFCKILDVEKGGEFRISPRGKHTHSRAYMGTTNVLKTSHATESGKYHLIDFMPVSSAPPGSAKPQSKHPSICRRIEGAEGECDVEIVFRPTFDFARATTVTEIRDTQVHAHAGDISLVLHSTVPFTEFERGGTCGRGRIKKGERIDFFLQCGTSAEDYADPLGKFDALLQETLDYWETWANKCTYHGKHRDLVQRSLLVLKLLTYAPSGAIVAAPTTSLPEHIGGVRNWDYRYTWIRDSALILRALMETGYHSESMQFFSWLKDLCINDRELQIMYTISGDPHLPEVLLEHLEGYRNSHPVRVGNAAALQKQLDIYGEMLDALHYCYTSMHMQGKDILHLTRKLANLAAARWREPDSGIWEVRGGDRHYLYSKLQCWVALDRAVKLVTGLGIGDEVEYWQKTRDEIRHAILTEGYNDEMGAFVQAFDVQVLDASALTIPLLGFLPSDDPRVCSTTDKISELLSVDGLVYRYLNDDGLPGGEATFALCSFWMVDNLVLRGQTQQARELFEKIIGYANDVGLFAEEFEPSSGELLGNFPQGFTHLALVHSAVRLAEAEKGKQLSNGHD
jgi:GH15 family glucan-1,4-alpha-glucosidase